MSGIAGVTVRVAEIQSRLVTIQTMGANPATATVARTTGTAAGSFASALADAVKATAAGATTSTTDVAKSYKLNSKGVPVELAAYGNGRIPASGLERIGNTGHKLWAPAAEALTRLIADAKRDGVRIGITDSYRPYAEQVDLARRKGLYSQGGLAAKPGTSEHGWGMAVDLDLNARAQAWMRANGPKYGFHENTPREPWHWGFEVKR